MTEAQEATCRICNEGWGRHQDLVERGVINHLFSKNGELTQVDRSPKKPARRQEVMVVPGADLLVRKLLIEKGLLSEEDFANAGAFGSVPAGDREDRPTQDTDGGLRASAGNTSHGLDRPNHAGAGDTESQPPAP